MTTGSRSGAACPCSPPLVDWSPHASIHPAFSRRAFGGRLVDDRGREWVDYLSGWGSNILGYGHPRVNAAIVAQLELGTGAGMASGVGREVEELLRQVVPCAEGVRFGKNGSDATAAAVRLARAVTGRERVLTHGYHGFHDWCLAVDQSCPGIPAGLRGTVEPLAWGNLERAERQLRRGAGPVAAVVVDPGHGPLPEPGYLQDLVDLARRNGAVVVFDEVGTGFRVAPGGAQELLGVTPDLGCFSKAMANGMPLSAVVGRGDLMGRLPDTRYGMTFHWEALSLAAARATILEVVEGQVCAELWRKGERLRRELRRRAAAAGVRLDLVGAAPRLQLAVEEQGGVGERALRWLFLQELARAGIHSAGLFLLCQAHDETDLEATVTGFERAVEALHRAVRNGSTDGLLEPALAAALAAVPEQAPPARGTRPLGRMIRAVAQRVRGPGRERGTNPGLPEGFDWRAYLTRYPDLVDAGVDSEAKAIRHWLEHGSREGRWCTTESYPPRRALLCPSVHSLFLRPWGDVVCWDDIGSGTVLQPFDPAIDYAGDVFFGPAFNRIRSALYRDRLPFPEACQRCICLRAGVEHGSASRDRRIMEVLEVEPTYLCTLDCPGCVRREARRHAPRPWSMPSSTLTKVLADLVAAGVAVKGVSFQGHGEPLLHPDLAGLVRLVRAHYPQTYVAVATNANGPFRPDLLEAGVNELICAVDGVDQTSYEPYRVGGDFATALRFMGDAVAARDGRAVRVVWRYHVFAHNDAPEQLLEAQRLALRLGVDQLLFVLTANGPRSTRVVREAHIPRLGGGVEVGCERHEPDPADLERRLVAARRLAADGSLDAAADLLASVAHNLVRAAPGGDPLGPAHEVVRDDLVRTVRELDLALAPRVRDSLRFLPR